MKQGYGIFTIAILLLTLPFIAQAAVEPGTITYSPDTVDLTLQSGASGTTSVTLKVADSTASSMVIRPVKSMLDGNLPIEWITASPIYKLVFNGKSLTAVLTISVPADTPSGVYAGHLVASAGYSHVVADPGTGIYISVTVPSLCAATPEVVINSFGPAVLWPPNHSLQAVKVLGSVQLPSGCTLLEASYRIDDEYGIYTAGDAFTVDGGDGTFEIVLPVEASRLGQDKDGRHYTITFTVTDEAGSSTSESLEVLVPHDQRK